MKEITLQEWLKTIKQMDAAKLMGISDGGLSQMKKSGRDVRIVLQRGQFDHWYEIKRRGKAA